MCLLYNLLAGRVLNGPSVREHNPRISRESIRKMAIARAFPHGCVADCPPSVRYHSDNVLFYYALQTFIGICGSTCHGRKCEY